jgi:FkbM family methyltransferase
VLVEVPGCDHIWMMNHGDDNVCQTYFYYGEGSYESLSTVLFGHLARQARNVLDVGGHTGLFTLIAAKADPVTNLHYFEVMPQIATRAKENFLISGIDSRVRVNNLGVSRTKGEMTVYFNENQPMWTGASLESLERRRAMPGAVETKVKVTTLDDYWTECGRPVMGLMKIDVEDHEIPVFEGATEMLKTCRPFIVSEILSEQKLRDYAAFLGRLGYAHVYEIDDSALKLRELDVDLKYTRGKPYVFKEYHNVLFSPKTLSRRFFDTLSTTLARSKLGRSAIAVG